VADVVGGPGLAEQIRAVAWLRWRVLRNSLRNKSRRLDLVGLIFSGFFSLLFVIGVTLAFSSLPDIYWRTILNVVRTGFSSAARLVAVVSYSTCRIRATFPFRNTASVSMNLSAFYLIGMAYGLADSAALAALV